MEQVEQEVVYTHNTGLLDTALHSLHWNGIGCDNGPDIQLYSQIVPLVLCRGGGVLGNLLTCARWHSARTHRTHHTPHSRHTARDIGHIIVGSLSRYWPGSIAEKHWDTEAQ